MTEWWSRASANFFGGVAAITLVAIPTFVWLPREFDEIHTQLQTIQVTAASAADHAQSASTNSASADQKIALLTEQMARTLALPIETRTDAWGQDLVASEDQIGVLQYLAVQSYMSPDDFLEIFPADTSEAIQKNGIAKKLLLYRLRI